jgi:hypothetical protein
VIILIDNNDGDILINIWWSFKQELAYL